MLEQDLYGRFAEVAVKRGNEMYFDRATALAFISACDVEDFAVIGIEGVRITRHATRPDPAWIADFSSGPQRPWDDTRRANNEEARDFVRRAPGDLAFSIVICSPEDARRT